MTAPAVEWDADRHELILAARQAALTGNHLLALELSEAVADGAAFLPDDVLFSLSATAVAACWPAPPFDGWRDLDTACTRALGLAVRGNR